MRPQEIKKIIKLYLLSAKNSFQIDLQYRVDFFTYIFQTILRIIVTFLFIQVLFTNVKSINGWTSGELMVLTLIFDLSRSFFEIFFRGVLDLSYSIKDGSLDRVLIRPINPTIQIIGSSFLVYDIPEFIITFSIFIFISNFFNVTVNYIYLCYILFISSIFYFSINLIIQTLNFYFLFANTSSIMGKEIFNLAKIPPSFFNKSSKLFLSFIFPIFISGGVLFMIQKNEIPSFLLINITVVIIAFLYFSLKFWNYSLKRYTGASS